MSGKALSPAAAKTEDVYLPIYVLTGVFGAIFTFGPLFVRKGPNKQIVRVCIMMAAFCMYLFWVTAYISQMHPLTGPRIRNTTLAWYQYKFGKEVAKPRGQRRSDDFKTEEDLDINYDINEATDWTAHVSANNELEPPKGALAKGIGRHSRQSKLKHMPPGNAADPPKIALAEGNDKVH